MNKDEALRFALLHITRIPTLSHGVLVKLSDVETAIKAALANEALERKAENAKELGLDYEPLETKDEPVAWVNFDDLYDLEAGEDGDVPYVVRGNEQPKNMPKSIPLYTHPPQRKPLTDEQIGDEFVRFQVGGMFTPFLYAVRAIEAAHGIKGEA